MSPAMNALRHSVTISAIGPTTQTMGSAEVGRELGDAGGPLLVGAIAAAVTLTPALLALGGLLTATAGLIAATGRRIPEPTTENPAA